MHGSPDTFLPHPAPMNDPRADKRRTRIPRWGLAIALPLLLLALAALWDWCRPGKIAPSGGLFFPRRLELPVPQFLQGDERWAAHPLGPTTGTLDAEGCAVASAAMTLASYGIDTDPARLNRLLTTNGGYTSNGWIHWEKAAEIAPGQVRFVYEGPPSHFLIDWNLIQRNPVIVRIRYPNAITHFVVIVGKAGRDYLIRDPGTGGVRGVYALREFGSDIEALRFYRGK